mmetsp:Transcript_71446/g.198331  ORF Transcript_71446/g.198331 Transcript_71446/m.198331 type:complete len:209 (-) Transcript_71446:2615-3241(-)
MVAAALAIAAAHSAASARALELCASKARRTADGTYGAAAALSWAWSACWLKAAMSSARRASTSRSRVSRATANSESPSSSAAWAASTCARAFICKTAESRSAATSRRRSASASPRAALLHAATPILSPTPKASLAQSSADASISSRRAVHCGWADSSTDLTLPTSALAPSIVQAAFSHAAPQSTTSRRMHSRDSAAFAPASSTAAAAR